MGGGGLVFESSSCRFHFTFKITNKFQELSSPKPQVPDKKKCSAKSCTCLKTVTFIRNTSTDTVGAQMPMSPAYVFGSSYFSSLLFPWCENSELALEKTFEIF